MSKRRSASARVDVACPETSKKGQLEIERELIGGLAQHTRETGATYLDSEILAQSTATWYPWDDRGYPVYRIILLMQEPVRKDRTHKRNALRLRMLLICAY